MIANHPDAPIPDLPALATEGGGSTPCGHPLPKEHRPPATSKRQSINAKRASEPLSTLRGRDWLCGVDYAA
jgi:hypothetical protein